MGYSRAKTEERFVQRCIESKLAALRRNRIYRERLMRFAIREARVSPETFSARLRQILSGCRLPTACPTLLIERFFNEGHYRGAPAHRIGCVEFVCEEALLPALHGFVTAHPLAARIESVECAAGEKRLVIRVRAPHLHPHWAGATACPSLRSAVARLAAEAADAGAPGHWTAPAAARGMMVEYRPSWEDPDWAQRPKPRAEAI